MNLPPTLINNVTMAFGDSGRNFLADLPQLLTTAEKRWNLKPGEPFQLSYNYVCPVIRSDGTDAVLKIGVPNRELTSEINTLRVYNGQGACRLFEADPETGMLLLEHLHPGTMLADLDDDDRATEIAAQVLQAVQRPVPGQDGFLNLHEWFDDLKNLRSRFGGGTGPFPPKSVEIVDGLLVDLFADDPVPVLLHGDFHHFNILLSERGWLVIDPKGVLGPAEYDVGPLLMNPWREIPDEREGIRRTQRRLAVLAERLGFDLQRMGAWAVCHSLLSAWWDMDNVGSGGESSKAWINIFLKACKL
jgi:streptomycin 6-kinase